ncbi:hypothetical protein BH10PAT3_BH10PAT3_6230 [soil metagenome]
MGIKDNMYKKRNSVIQGGYSEKMLQPCYLVGIGIIFLLTPRISLFWSSVAVLVPAFFVAKKVFKAQEKNGSLRRVRKEVPVQPKRYASSATISLRA